MEISSISFSKPYIKYDSIVYHFTSRKSIAIEWVILELINRYSNDNEYGSISIKTILENMLFIPDTDSLVLPSIIELINLRALESDFYINENTSLSSISLSQIRLTDSGKELQAKGLIPGKEAEDIVSFIYDISENIFELYDDKLKFDNSPKGIKLVEYDDDDEEDDDDDDEYIFDFNKAKSILEELKNKNKFSWLQPTSEIRDIDRGDIQVLWRNFNDRINLLEDGKIELKDKKNDDDFNKLLIENIDSVETLQNNYDDDLDLYDFNYNNFSKILNIYETSKIDEKLKNILGSKDFVIVNKKLYQDEIKISSNLLLVFGSDDFSIDIKDKKMTLYIEDDMILKNCIALNKDKTNVCISNFRVHNDFGDGVISLGYSISHQIDFNEIVSELINKYQIKDARILLISLIIGGIEAFRNNVLYLFNIIENFDDALNFISDIINNAKALKLDDNQAKNILNHILSNNKKVNDTKTINLLIAYLMPIVNSKTLDNNSISKLYLSIIKRNNIKSLDYNDLNTLFDYLKHIKAEIKDIDSVSKNLYQNAFIDMMKKYMSDTKYRFEEFSSIEKSINSFANNIKSIEESLKLKIGDIYNNISASSLSPKIIEYYKTSKDKDKILNNLNNIDKILKDISSKLEITEEDFKNNGIINAALESIKSAVYKLNDKSINNFTKVYAVDTNVLLNEPKIFDYIDSKTLLIIPITVIEELDKLKEKSDEDMKFKAREAIRNIEANNNKANIRKEDYDNSILPEGFDKNKNDNKILAAAMKFLAKDVVLITDDNNLKVKADSQSIKYISLEDFKNNNLNKKDSNQKDSNNNKK
ncbi:PIN domain-containing protein [uncultured Brachyspira sp.]|uniref:PIN domain-containing protein n=1 Tax=uncultured Brachyspira sp. TaxID=221953 RepID=UPI00262E9D62|nr:PIN domain-containing protein [uncultured Brachyspira sp.]